MTDPSFNQLAAAAAIESALLELLLPLPNPLFNNSRGLLDVFVSAMIRLRYAASLAFFESFVSATAGGSRDRLRSPDARVDPWVEGSRPARMETAGEVMWVAEFDGAFCGFPSSGSLSDRVPKRSRLRRRSTVCGGSRSTLSLRGDGGLESGRGTGRPAWRVNLCANAFRRFRFDSLSSSDRNERDRSMNGSYVWDTFLQLLHISILASCPQNSWSIKETRRCSSGIGSGGGSIGG